MGPPGDVTALIVASSHGNREALDRLVQIVYDRLRALARARLRGERRDHTLDSAALVNEAYLKLVGFERLEWRDRTHFFATASRLMRRILVDHAHRRNAAKRGGNSHRVELPDVVIAERLCPADAVLALDEALEHLESISPRGARAVECRYFAGLSLDETAAALGVAVATAKRDLRFAQAWLGRALSRETSHGIESSGTDRAAVSGTARPEPRCTRRSP
jgi:RNA polymerase sigma factor (TIGR02999 family)